MVHGGDIYRNKVLLDFSINVNPLGMPRAVELALHHAVGRCGTYPDMKNEALLCALEALTGVAKQQIVCGNGASELFLAVIHALAPKRTVIPVPSFYGYEYAAAASESQMITVPMNATDAFALTDALEAQLTDNVDLLFLANPNNPTGTLLEPERLEQILVRCREKHITVVIDECFMELTGKEATYSAKGQLPTFPNLIVIRAFTKLFSIPGVRLGFLFCGNDALLSRIKGQLPEWNLSVFAQEAGVAACREREFIKASAVLVAKERAYMTGALEKLGIQVYPSAANYLLLYTKLPLYEALLARKILIRDCGNFQGLGDGFYRVAVKNHDDNRRLMEAVSTIIEKRKNHA